MKKKLSKFDIVLYTLLSIVAIVIFITFVFYYTEPFATYVGWGGVLSIVIIEGFIIFK